ncbi:MAG TPA: Ppx/GppA family phosphatase, partial [bacterium]|nr:Ppx/GppA family phosphatase [bacterium]
VGGTATTFAALAQALPEYNPRAVHGARVPSAHITRLTRLLGLMTTAERGLFPGLGPGRADIIVAGGVILQAVLRVFGQEMMIASDNGILLGLLAERA